MEYVPHGVFELFIWACGVIVAIAGYLGVSLFKKLQSLVEEVQEIKILFIQEVQEVKAVLRQQETRVDVFIDQVNDRLKYIESKVA